VTVAPYTMAEYAARWAEVETLSNSMAGPSLADRLALCEADEPGFIDALLDSLTPEQVTQLAYSWDFWARPKQKVPPGDWIAHFDCTARGGGKTRKASGWIIERMEQGAKNLILVGPSMDDVEEYMVGGNDRLCDGGNGSALLDVLAPWIRYEWKKDDGVIEFPDFAAVVRLHSAEVPEYRGPGPDSIWGDELLKWRYPERLISNLRLACRSVRTGLLPQLLFTSSPKRLKFLRDLVMDRRVVTYTGETSENRGNVHENWYQAETERLKGTRQGLEELGGKLLGDDEGDKFPMGLIEANRVDEDPTLDRIVVGVDPAGSEGRGSDETGLVVVGRVGGVDTGHAYVLDEATRQYPWEAWGKRAYELAERHGASAFVIERNKFADAAAANLRTSGARRGYESQPRPGFKTLIDMVHVDLVAFDANGRELKRERGAGSRRRIQIVEVLAKGDKATRAEPLATLYEAGRVHHVGRLAKLEDEMSSWDPKTSESPNGLDALVHGATELFGLDKPPKRDASEGLKGFGAAVERLTGKAAESQTGPSAMSAILTQMSRGRWGSRL
jgi:phage terminase large subunit-like protein